MVFENRKCFMDFFTYILVKTYSVNGKSKQCLVWHTATWKSFDSSTKVKLLMPFKGTCYLTLIIL